MPRAAGARTKTKYPGIYRLPSGRYEYLWRDADGRQRSGRADTVKEAREDKAEEERKSKGGVQVDDKVTFAAYACAWVETYFGRSTSKAIGDRTRDEYRRDLNRYVIPFLGRRRLTKLRRKDVREFVAWLADDDVQRARHKEENERRLEQGQQPIRLAGEGRLSDATIRRIYAVLSACLQTARSDDEIADNWCRDVALPQRDEVAGDAGSTDDEDGEVRVFTRDELRTVLEIVPPRWSVFFDLLAESGIRISEALALSSQHLRFVNGRWVIRVRVAVKIGRNGVRVLGPPKSRHGRRDIPISEPLAQRIRAQLPNRPPQDPAMRERWGDLIFRPARGGGQPFRAESVYRVLKPFVEEAGAPWAAFHTFRHTFASLHIADGTNIVKLSRLMGHHSPAFTLSKYTHLMEDGLGDPLDVHAILAKRGQQGDSMGTAERTETDGTADTAIRRILSSEGAISD